MNKNMNKNINKVLKVDLVDMVTEQTAKLTLARGIYKAQRAQIEALNQELFNRTETMNTMQKELNSLRAYLYPVNETASDTHKAIQNSDSNHPAATPADDTKHGYANDTLMSKAQTKLYCDLWSKYEGIQLPKTHITRDEARTELKNLMALRDSGELKLRAKPYRPAQVLEKYLDKYITTTC